MIVNRADHQRHAPRQAKGTIEAKNTETPAQASDIEGWIGRRIHRGHG